MRLWTLHPRYLDGRGLVALWREALLAQKVLRGLTRGYRQHPQLVRFLDCGAPEGAIAAFLVGVAAEARARGYAFDLGRIAGPAWDGEIEETEGQLRFEAEHLRAKLAARSPGDLARLLADQAPAAHPLFRLTPGGVRSWERGAGG